MSSWRCNVLGHAWQPCPAGPDQYGEFCERCAKEQTTSWLYAGPAAGLPRLVTPRHEAAEPVSTR